MKLVFQHPTNHDEIREAFDWDQRLVAFYQRPGWLLIEEIVYSGPVADVDGLTELQLNRLAEMGYTAAEALRNASDHDLTNAGLSQRDIRKVRMSEAKPAPKRGKARSEIEPPADVVEALRMVESGPVDAA